MAITEDNIVDNTGIEFIEDACMSTLQNQGITGAEFQVLMDTLNRMKKARTKSSANTLFQRDPEVFGWGNPSWKEHTSQTPMWGTLAKSSPKTRSTWIQTPSPGVSFKSGNKEREPSSEKELKEFRLPVQEDKSSSTTKGRGVVFE